MAPEAENHRKGQQMTMCVMIIGLALGMAIGIGCECVARRIGERKFLADCKNRVQHLSK